MSVTEGQSQSSPNAAPAEDGPDTLLPVLQEATAGDYEILGELGRGGMAAVYLATDVALNRKVAIKTMLPELTSRQSMVARFKREAQMAAGLSHPHIVQIFTVKQTPKIVFFVMKFIEGRSLDSIIAEHGAMDLEMARLIMQQAGSALSFAHHRGVVHRDVKPANIMIDENGWAVVTDFGIAKVDDGNNLTATGTTVGTPDYMAPEQFHAKPLTGAADQYSLGIVAYQMLSGKKPFNGTTLAEIITQHLFSDPPDIRTERPDLPPAVSDALVRMLAKDPAHRFPDLDSAIVGLGAPDPVRVDEARGRLMSYARAGGAKAPRLSVPLSPVPMTGARPSAPTTVMRNSVPPKPAASGDVTAARPVAARGATPVPDTRESTTPRKSRAWLWAAAALIVVAVPSGIFAYRYGAQRALPENNASLQRGMQLWQQGQSAGALMQFNAAAAEMPTSALPHVYLARLARERGDLPAAAAEATNAARLEPNNAIALRELGLVLYARGNYRAARNFLVRSIKANPADKASMGWLACTFRKLGNTTEAALWADRAGPGVWQSCAR
jgi:Protein kinase domain